jgi:hypothetical protein
MIRNWKYIEGNQHHKKNTQSEEKDEIGHEHQMKANLQKAHLQKHDRFHFSNKTYCL